LLSFVVDDVVVVDLASVAVGLCTDVVVVAVVEVSGYGKMGEKLGRGIPCIFWVLVVVVDPGFASMGAKNGAISHSDDFVVVVVAAKFKNLIRFLSLTKN
jgi:hypothetical protein